MRHCPGRVPWALPCLHCLGTAVLLSCPRVEQVLPRPSLRPEEIPFLRSWEGHLR